MNAQYHMNKFFQRVTVFRTLSLYFSITLFSALLAAVSTGDGSPATQQPNQKIQSFSEAKKYMEKVVYSSEPVRRDFYCDCPYDAKKSVLPAACGYVPKKESARSRRIEWEHVVPAENFGRFFVEWRDGSPACIDGKGKAFKGRKCAEKTNPQFRAMAADMYNLVPAIGELNQLRSNYQYAMIDGEPREFGKCDFEVMDKKVEPRPELRGDIARTYFYMAAAYPKVSFLSDKQRKLFEAWSAQDPVDRAECERSAAIEKVQGNKNLTLESACRALLKGEGSEPDLHQEML